MSLKARSAVKRLLPNSLLRKQAKKVWEIGKRVSDRNSFRKKNVEAFYIYFSADDLSEIRDGGYLGQIGQDFLLDCLFRKDTGTFIDIGANRPVAISNTYFFEKKGWTGYAFDPMKSLAGLWTQRPKTVFINAGISDRVETRKFVEIKPKVGWEHALSSFKEYVRDEDLRDYEHVEYEVESGPVSHFIDLSSGCDFVSIDVEGAEKLILNGFDFDSFPPLAIVLENNQQIGGIQEHRDFLKTKGYKLIARINASDDLFVHTNHVVPEEFSSLARKYIS